MKIQNPNFNDRSPAVVAGPAKLLAYLNANAGVASLDFDQARAAIPDFAGLSDGEVHQIALDAGLVVDPVGVDPDQVVT